jgi:hypothetical protein
MDKQKKSTRVAYLPGINYANAQSIIIREQAMFYDWIFTVVVMRCTP